MTALTEIALPQRLQYLVQYCEKNCVAGCCGIDAFDFSPLHVASFMSSYTGRISPSDIAELEAEIMKFEASFAEMLPNEDGYVCSVVGMNQYFTRASFNAFIAELRHNIRVSPLVLERSEQLRSASTKA
jgi:hypothetical protein